MPWPTNRRIIGTEVQRLDGPDKSTGRAKYSYDINRPGMLHARMLRCPHAHARIRAINTQAAERLPGFRAVHVIARANTELYFAGAEVLAIAADTEEHAEDCIRAVNVDYQVLPHYVREQDAIEAAANARTAPGFNPANVRVGGQYATENFEEQAYRNATQRVEGTYGVPVICHQCLESHGLVAEWNSDQTELTVWASTQAVPGTAGALARHFRIPAGRVKCITHHMGGGYGSKFGAGYSRHYLWGTSAYCSCAGQINAPTRCRSDNGWQSTICHWHSAHGR